MQDSRHTPAPDCGCAESQARALTRRRLVGAAAGTLATTPLHAMAQSTPETEQPVATPSASVAIDLERLATVSLALVGGGTLAEEAVQTLGELISADPARVAAFEELAGLDDSPTQDAVADLSGDARALAEEIIGFWYLGAFDGKPVENRASLYFGLPVWGTLPYITQPTLCKSFGYWANEVSLSEATPGS